jgi:prepilin-type processing-associated H-X9-DG protein
MLVRAGAVPVKQFICPSSGDLPDPAADVELYYDFFDIGHVSYGYQVPFGRLDTRPREGMDHRQVLAADKGPWYRPTPVPDWRAGSQATPVNLNHAAIFWRPYNSPYHGGAGNGEGQNVLFADGHTAFERIPAVGVDHDNIYTLMVNNWSIVPFNRIHGETPHQRRPPPYPGQNALGTRRQSTTDSLIYP